MGNFIFNPLTGEPTILATNRAKRSDQTGAVDSIKPTEKEKTQTSEKKPQESKPDKGPDEDTQHKACFFCKGNEGMTPPTLYRDADDWNVRVFANKFPLMSDHEVVVHSPHHDKDIEDLDHEQNTRILRAYLNRAHHFGDQEKEVIIFNNKGGKAGASVLHPHSQIVASKGFPGILEKEKESALHYYNEHNSCFWCDEMEKELKYRKRVVLDSSKFLLYVPFACRWSYEMRLIPKHHKPNFGFIDETELNDLASVLKTAVTAYNNLFDRPDRNFWIHTMRYEPYHWHIGFIPHLKVFGALELGAGIWVSDKATPEDAAQQLAGAIGNNHQ